MKEHLTITNRWTQVTEPDNLRGYIMSLHTFININEIIKTEHV